MCWCLSRDVAGCVVVLSEEGKRMRSVAAYLEVVVLRMLLLAMLLVLVVLLLVLLLLQLLLALLSVF